MPRKQAARKRHTTLTLRLENVRHRRGRILRDYRKAFAGFSSDELAILDGVILEPARSESL